MPEEGFAEFCGRSEGLPVGEMRTDFEEEAAHDLGLESVASIVREIRSHMLHSVAKINK